MVTDWDRGVQARWTPDWAHANCAPRPHSGRGAQSMGETVYLAWIEIEVSNWLAL